MDEQNKDGSSPESFVSKLSKVESQWLISQKELEKKIKEARTRANLSNLILGFIILIFLLFSLGIIFYLDNRLEQAYVDLNELRAQIIQNEFTQDSSLSSAPKALDNFEAIKDFEGRISRLEEFQSEIDSTFESWKWILGFIITIASFLMAFQRYLRQKKEEEERNRVDDYMKKIQDNNDKLASNNDSLFKKSEGNIQAVTDLIKSYEQMFAVAKDAKEIKDRTIELSKIEKERKERRIKEVAKVLDNAQKIFGRITRDNYKKLSFQNELNKFSIEFLRLVDNEDGEKVKFSSICYYLVALNYSVQVIFDEAIAYFRLAIEKAGTEGQSQVIQESYFHIAIIYYNFGLYQDALDNLESFIETNKEDGFVLTYLPEAKQLRLLEESKAGRKTEEELRREREQIEKEFQNLVLRVEEIAGSRKGKMVSLAYIKFGNFYFRPPIPFYLKQRSYIVNLNKALEMYEVAKKADEGFYLSKLSYAQVILIKKYICNQDVESEKLIEAEKCIRNVYKEVRIKAGSTTEGKIIIMYYYILGICESFLRKIEGDSFSPQGYKNDIPDFQRLLPEALNEKHEIRIFSPYSKQDLTFSEIIDELENI